MLLSLIYLSSKVTDDSLDVELINGTLELIKTPEQINDDDESSAISYLKGIIQESMSNNKFDRKNTLKRLKIVTSGFPEYYKYASEFLEEDPGDFKTIRETVSQHKIWLRGFINQTVLKKTVGKLYGSLNRSAPEEVNTNLDELKILIDGSRNIGQANRRLPGLVSSIGTNEPAAFSKIFKQSSDVLNGAVFKTGFRTVNKMFGVQDGIRMTELGLMPGLPFNGKTLFSQSILLSMGIVNNAEDFRPFIPDDKTPMFLDLSLENGADVNIPQAFEMLYVNLERKKFDASVVLTPEELVIYEDVTVHSRDSVEFKVKEAVRAKVHDWMGDYISNNLSKNGWHYQFDQYINSDFSISFLPDIISDYESKGYHIMGVRGDYLGTIKKEGMGNGIGGSDIKELYRRARNCTAVKDKFALLPHQLSTEAKRFRAMDINNFIRELPGRGYYEYCSSLDNEADWELFFGMIDVGGRRFFEVKRGKHRHGGKTKSEDTYTVIPVNPEGLEGCILPWDMLHDEPMAKASVSDFFDGAGGGFDF